MNENSMNNAVTMRSQSGASLGRIDQYELIRELGGGGFGCVYLAKDTVSGIEVAVKGLPPLVRLNKEELENVRQNFALVSRLYHPNIAAALHFQKVQSAVYNDDDVKEKLRVFNGDPLVVMQYARGVTLSQWRKQFPDGKVPLDKAIEITRQIASALDYAHKERIIHRDIKPANVMIETLPDRSITVRVLDFGLAAEIRSSMGRLSLNVTDKSGTRHYMAPEQWSGKKQSKETDQYSLAALFYELILGEVPFASVFDTGDTVLMKTVVENDSPEIPHDLPKSVRLALAKALSKKREDRFASCSEFVDALQGGLISGARASSRPFFSRAVAILAAVAALGIAFGGIWYWQSAKSEAEVSQKTAIVRDIEEEKRLCDDEIERQFSVRHHCDYVERMRDKARSQIFKAYPGFMDNLKKMTLRERCRIAFFLSAYSCKKSISFILDEKLLDVNDVGDGGFLHCAACACDKDMIDFLIARGADVNKQDKDGQSPISWASADGARGISMIKYLIERHGARIVNVNDDKSLFMDLAGRSNFQEGAKYLIEERSYVPTSDELQKLGEKDKAYIESLLKKRQGASSCDQAQSMRGDRMFSGETHDKVQLWEGGPYWATRNIGADKPEDFGYYFWWGDTVGYKREYWKWVSSDGSIPNFLFYYDNDKISTYGKSISELEREGWIEKENGTYTLTSKHDAAQAYLGGAWRMPTKDEFDNLVEKCDWTWTTRNGKNGYVVRGRGNYASKSIFLPCAGYGERSSLNAAGVFGYYWSSVPDSVGLNVSWGLSIDASSYYMHNYRRTLGHSVRPVQGFTK